MKKITTILILILSLGVYSQDIKITYDEDQQSYIINSNEPINKVEYARVKNKQYNHLKTVELRNNTYVIPNNYFKYRKIRVTITTQSGAMIQDFITKNKRR